MAIKSTSYKKSRIGVADIHGKQHLFIEGEYIPAIQAKNPGHTFRLIFPIKVLERCATSGRPLSIIAIWTKRK